MQIAHTLFSPAGCAKQSCLEEDNAANGKAARGGRMRQTDSGSSESGHDRDVAVRLASSPPRIWIKRQLFAPACESDAFERLKALVKSCLLDFETAWLFASKTLLRPPEIKKVHQASVLALRFLVQPLQHAK